MGCGNTKTKENLKDEVIKVENKAKGGSKSDSKLSIIDEVISLHNKYRKLHGCPEIVHNPELTKIAQTYADKIASENNFSHSNCKWGDKHIGENLSWCNGIKITAEVMTDMWYNEIKFYDFDNPQFSSEAGHFTQVVWKNTKEIGVGISQSSDGAWYGVANYYPPGNVVGQFEENVQRLI